MRLWRRPTLLINAALAVLAVAGGFWGYQIVHGEATASAASNTSTRSRIVTVTEGTVTSTASASGTVASASTATANFVTSGVVTEINVKVGDVVTKGQVLAKVDSTAVEAQLDTAKANRAAAYAAQARAKSAGADAATLASASAQVTSAEAAVTTAQQAVDGTVLTAPIAGTVTVVNGAVGSSSGSTSSSNSSSNSNSSSSSAFIQLADLTKMQVNAGYAEADATKLKAGQSVNVTWSALSGARATGKVTTIAPTATTTNNVNTYAVVISLDTLPSGVRIGQSVTAVVTVAEAQNVIRVPTTALRSAGGQYTVQVSVNGQTQPRTVEVGVQGNQYVEIISGLTVGEQIVITTTTSSSTTNNQFPGGGNFPGGGGGLTGLNNGGGATRGGN
jgi:macrolide-specific efflux system membrane fusion protein